MRNVLLVDDEPLIVKGMQSIIDWNANHLQIADTACNGVEALAKLDGLAVDLVITDIMMPQMTGLELIREVKVRSPLTKFIILSGYEEFNYVREGITLGVENYLLKPVNIDELEATIKHMQHDWETEEVRQIQMDLSWRILRTNILQRWANATIDAKEFRERAQLLEIPLTKSSYCAAALRIVAEHGHGMEDPQFYRPIIAEQCETIGRQHVPDGCEIICFPDQEGDIIVLFASTGREGEEWQYQALCGMKQWIASDTGACVWSVKGQPEQSSLGFPQSCKQVKLWLQNHLLGDSETFIVASDNGSKPAQTDEKWEPAMDQFHKLLRDGKSLEVDRFIDDFFDVQAEHGHMARTPCFNSAIQLMLAAKNLEKTPDYGGVFGPLSRIDTLSGLKRLVKRVVHQTLDTYHATEKDYSPHVMAVLDFVKNYYQEELSLKTLSQKLDLHPNYLGQLFQQEAGTSFSDYVNQYRIERATHLLLYSDKKTAEVATEVGYWDTSYFYRQFKKYAGVSPTELRSMYMKK
ncbi:response regulator transcription factor [Paenibacillus jilunlii]|uniref:AraC family transcriptional regulator n=1 Tax=Paenibacillus jilunlii TaxID=682956 RepID=A0A1G9KQW2_9BACL|nr:response regulator transcription factor [Paenibacillus jilunlii]KWX69855.1 AraC family transcriptional regulator [Paenibacillus jilunlii]SDL51996.1 two-component system, response regulator YesN [Paenibacillus jilunlii]